MKEYQEADPHSLVSLFNELKSKFEQKLLHGECFEEAKKVYRQMKELEAQLNVVDWQKPKN